MNRTRVLIGKTLINSGICLMMQLYMPWLSYYAEQYGSMIIMVSVIVIIIGIIICRQSGNPHCSQSIHNIDYKMPLVKTYFKIIKWTIMSAIVFHIISAFMIVFFYWLSKEFEATLTITFVTGIVIGFIWGVAIPYYRNNKDNDKTN